MQRALISRAVLTDLRELFVAMHVLRTIEDAFGSEGIKRESAQAMSVTGERRQLVEAYYASLDLADTRDVQKLLRAIEREIIAFPPDPNASFTSDLRRVLIGLEQAGYRLVNHKILPTGKTPLISLQGHLEAIDSFSLLDDWSRMLAAVEMDPEDAITSARAVVESTCKAILEQLNVPYEDKWDAGRLYKETAHHLQLSPGGYHEQVFKQILSGLFSVSSGLAEVRNAFGDAHGKGKRPVRATARHARLAVNAAGTLVVFLLETLGARGNSSDEQ